jgi:hypothetical protein
LFNDQRVTPTELSSINLRDVYVVFYTTSL